MIRYVLGVSVLVAVVLLLTVGVARVGARFDREQPPMPATPSPILRAPVAGPDPLFTEADFDRAYRYLATQRREGSR